MARLRAELTTRLAAARPADERRLVEFRFPERIPNGHPLAGGDVSRGDLPPPSDPSTPTAVSPSPSSGKGSLNPGSPSKPASGSPQPAGMAVTRVVQGRPQVMDAIIDPREPTKNFGDTPRDVRLARGEAGSALLLKFDLQGVAIPPGAVLRRAEVAVYEWDPSSQGKMRVDAAGILIAWDERSVNWERPTAHSGWKKASFAIGQDTGTVVATKTIVSDPVNDRVDPPNEHRWEITRLAQSWLSGQMPNHGVALIAVDH